MKRTMRVMSTNGDDQIAEYEVGVTSPERLAEIEVEFKDFMRKGFTPADITDQRDTIIDKFNPNADILMIPRIQGGR